MNRETVNQHHQRRIEIDGTVNFRDLGGLPTTTGRRIKAGLLFRADSLADLNRAGQVALSQLRLKTIIDFRSHEERSRHPDRLPEPNTYRVHPLGFLPLGNRDMFSAVNSRTLDAAGASVAMQTQYRRIALDHLGIFRAMFRILKPSTNYPVLLHCTSGKDRTGVGIALILRTIGVELESIFDDYVVSNDFRRKLDYFDDGADKTVIESILAARQEYLAAAFAGIDASYGDFDSFVRDGLELSPAAVADLSAKLLL